VHKLGYRRIAHYFIFNPATTSMWHNIYLQNLHFTEVFLKSVTCVALVGKAADEIITIFHSTGKPLARQCDHAAVDWRLFCALGKFGSVLVYSYRLKCKYISLYVTVYTVWSSMFVGARITAVFTVET
jgi:hypothetical protein